MEQLQNSSSSDSDAELSVSTIASSSDSVSSKSSHLLTGLQSPLSESSVSTSTIYEWYKEPVHKSPTCFFDRSTCQRQSFSIPEKIVFYMAKNCTNATTFLKLIQTCKYFFKVNPVVVVPELTCNFNKWYTYQFDVDGEYPCKLDGLKNVKIWIQHELRIIHGDVSQLIPHIYRIDALDIKILALDEIMTFGEFLFIAGNAEKVYMLNQTIKDEHGEIVPFEDIIGNLPKLKYLKYKSRHDESCFTKNTAEKLMKIESFKNVTYLDLCWLPETFNIETMFNYILENKHIQVNLCYISQVSNHYKVLIQRYSNLLEKEDGCISKIGGSRLDYFDTDELFDNSSSEGSISDTSFVNLDDDDNNFGNDYFPWNNEDEEEWELPWDTKE